MGESMAHSRHETTIEHRVTLGRLRPGMMLSEDICLNNGKLILSSGHTLTELSINRLRDMSDLLFAQEVVIQEAH